MAHSELESASVRLRQASADLRAGGAQNADTAECHRRYWLQQACEKGIKALGTLIWNGPDQDESLFRKLFLHQHSPLANLTLEAGKAPKSIRLLLRQVQSELSAIDGSGLLMKVDATTPSTALGTVSYRYPFQDPADTSRLIPPCDYPDWDAYQGNDVGVSSAVERLLRSVRNRVRLQR